MGMYAVSNLLILWAVKNPAHTLCRNVCTYLSGTFLQVEKDIWMVATNCPSQSMTPTRERARLLGYGLSSYSFCCFKLASLPRITEKSIIYLFCLGGTDMSVQTLPGFVTAHSPISKYPSIKGIQKLEKVDIFYFKVESLTLSITEYFMIKNKI